MEKNNQRTLTIVMITTILILVIIFTGITYAFFTANNPEGSTAQIISENGRMLITYDDGTDSIVPVEDIQPSNKILVNKTFTLTGSNTTVGMNTGDGLTMQYKVGVRYTSGFSDGMMHYYIKEVNRPTDSKVTTYYVITTEEGKSENDYINQTIPGNNTYTEYVHGTFKYGNNKYTEMVTGEFPASKNDQTITFNLIIQFPDNNENQDSEKGKTFSGKIVINYDNSISTYLTKLDKTENGLEIDETEDKNIRYVGSSPKNYLNFNDETWRIIGIFNVYNVETNKYENLVKIIRNEPLGKYSWDSSDSTINSGYGINEWSQADLMYELNCDGNENSPYCRDDITNGYLSNLTDGTDKWYNGQNNEKNGTYNYDINIKKTSIDKIAKVRWNLGGTDYELSALNSYNQERGTSHISNPIDGIARTDTWEGKIGLMYPSDYGFASTNIACRNKMNSSKNNVSDCTDNNWIFNNLLQWTLTSKGMGTNIETGVFIVGSSGFVGTYNAFYFCSVRPVLYLKSTAIISGGYGTIDNPYKID